MKKKTLKIRDHSLSPSVLDQRLRPFVQNRKKCRLTCMTHLHKTTTVGWICRLTLWVGVHR